MSTVITSIVPKVPARATSFKMIAIIRGIKIIKQEVRDNVVVSENLK